MDIQNKKRSNTIMNIAATLLIIFILGGVIAWVALVEIDDDYAAIGFAVFAGCLLQGIMVFGIIYGIGVVASNTEDIKTILMNNDSQKLEKSNKRKDDDLPTI